MAFHIKVGLTPETIKFMAAIQGFKRNYFTALVGIADLAGTKLTEHTQHGITGNALGLAPNSPAWSEAKGGKPPLEHTGQLVGQLTWGRLITTIALIKIQVGFEEGMHSHFSHKRRMKLPGSNKHKTFSKAIPTWYLALIHQRGSYAKTHKPASKRPAARMRRPGSLGSQNMGIRRDPFEAVVRLYGKEVVAMFLQALPRALGL